jgi:hypothetical protein
MFGIRGGGAWIYDVSLDTPFTSILQSHPPADLCNPPGKKPYILLIIEFLRRRIT